MARNTKKRRQSHGLARNWKQTDCWYYTHPGTKKRVALFDEQGERIRGKENREAAEISLAREKLAWDGESDYDPALGQPWLVARVCSDYLVYTERSQNDGSVSEGYHRNATQWIDFQAIREMRHHSSIGSLFWLAIQSVIDLRREIPTASLRRAILAR